MPGGRGQVSGVGSHVLGVGGQKPDARCSVLGVGSEELGARRADHDKMFLAAAEQNM